MNDERLYTTYLSYTTSQTLPVIYHQSYTTSPYTTTCDLDTTYRDSRDFFSEPAFLDNF